MQGTRLLTLCFLLLCIIIVVVVGSCISTTRTRTKKTVFGVFGKIIKASSWSERSPGRLRGGGGDMHEGDDEKMEIIFESVDAAHLAQSRMQ